MQANFIIPLYNDTYILLVLFLLRTLLQRAFYFLLSLNPSFSFLRFVRTVPPFYLPLSCLLLSLLQNKMHVIKHVAIRNSESSNHEYTMQSSPKMRCKLNQHPSSVFHAWIFPIGPQPQQRQALSRVYDYTWFYQLLEGT